MKKITEKELRKKINKNAIEHHLKLVRWLYINYKGILREYERTLGNLRVEFA